MLYDSTYIKYKKAGIKAVVAQDWDGIYSKWAKKLFKAMNMFQNSVTLLQKSMICTIIMGEFYSMYIPPQ